jgi:arabinofuranosyltransferase
MNPNPWDTTLARRCALAVFWCLFAWLFYQYAWIAEDAFINFRVIDHVQAGDGLVWNTGERVQVYTSVLWMALSIGVTALTHEPVYSTWLLSFTLVVIAWALLWRASGQRLHTFLLVGIALLSCHSIRDYLSSGLETPLVMAAVAVCMTTLTMRPTLPLRQVSTLLACCALVRHDLLPLLLPFGVAHVLHAQGQPRWSDWRRWLGMLADALVGAWPLLAWSAFAWFYYGSPFPNTALAKIVPGFPGARQALNYFAYMQGFDPLAYPLMAATLAAAWCWRSRWLVPLRMALFLFAAYLMHVGGDYMAGRFFVAPLTLCAFMLARVLAEVQDQGQLTWPTSAPWQARLSLCLMLCLNLAMANLALRKNHPSELVSSRVAFVDGIADERQYYWGATDVFTIRKDGVNFQSQRDGQALWTDGDKGPFLTCNIGMTGYFSPLDTRIIDPMALSDRFLSGLPTVHTQVRIGHFERVVPRDYMLSLLSGRNRFGDPTLGAYFDDVQMVVRGPLWSWPRLQALWRLSMGAHKARLAKWNWHDGGGALMAEGADPHELRSYCLGGIGRVMRARLTATGVTVQAMPHR